MNAVDGHYYHTYFTYLLDINYMPSLGTLSETTCLPAIHCRPYSHGLSMSYHIEEIGARGSHSITWYSAHLLPKVAASLSR